MSSDEGQGNIYEYNDDENTNNIYEIEEKTLYGLNPQNEPEDTKFTINQNEEEEEPPLIRIRIKISDDEYEYLIVKQNENINDKVDEFCIQHNLRKDQKDLIMNYIKQSIDKELTNCKKYFI